jgi:hypothetical protein
MLKLQPAILVLFAILGNAFRQGLGEGNARRSDDAGEAQNFGIFFVG